MIKRIVRGFLLFLAAMLGLAVLFAIAAMVFALFPMPGRTQLADGEPAIYLCATLAHSDIVVPSRDPLADWQGLFPAVAKADLPQEAYLAFGWGDLRFFQETPDWADVKMTVALAALAGLHETALRVVAVNSPDGNPECLKLRVDHAGRLALIHRIEATLRRDTLGRPQWRAGSGELEAYYLAEGRYSPLRTCNQWVAEALAEAGLPHALFAPFSFSVTQPLAATASR